LKNRDLTFPDRPYAISGITLRMAAGGQKLAVRQQMQHGPTGSSRRRIASNSAVERSRN